MVSLLEDFACKASSVSRSSKYSFRKRQEEVGDILMGGLYIAVNNCGTAHLTDEGLPISVTSNDGVTSVKATRMNIAWNRRRNSPYEIYVGFCEPIFLVPSDVFVDILPSPGPNARSDSLKVLTLYIDFECGILIDKTPYGDQSSIGLEDFRSIDVYLSRYVSTFRLEDKLKELNLSS